ncbi:hypothetical protein FNL56_18395 [Tardiphaga sp. vice304]|uniref:hypothetical protein n=1 Tax=Tardiphaga sp. vice304 TaxID=2592817 RepID=UPI0011629000|nr:hypothetical protein [Tardiphaga sp. vice304]QDM27878.1 hypothetical protein FNL56_18395 [Tardiphaga sp. vice304]
MMSGDPRDLDAAAVIELCAAGLVPVNVLPGVAIAVHRQMATPFTLRAVLLACTPTVEDSRTQLDYLADLPDAAWCSIGPEWQNYREASLASMRRSIAWRTVCV